MSQFEFLTSLTESRLLPTYFHLTKQDAKWVSQLIYLYLCAINILMREAGTEEWTRRYARHTIQYGNFTVARSVANDLYVLIYAVESDHADFEVSDKQLLDRMSIDLPTIVTYLRNIMLGHESHALTRKLFVNLDTRFKVQDSSLRAVRRLAMEWQTLSYRQKKLCMTRLMQLFRRHASKSELLPFLLKVARDNDLDIKDTDDAEPVHESVLKQLHPVSLEQFEGLEETASAGATGSASVATVAGGLGAGFNPEGDYGIYQNKRKKPFPIIRRYNP